MSSLTTIDLESLEMKENDTVAAVENVVNQTSERVVFREMTTDTNNLPVPNESRFPLSSNEQLEETLRQAVQHFNNCTVNIQNYFAPQSTNQASSSRVECQIGELRSLTIPLRKRRRAYIIDSDED